MIENVLDALNHLQQLQLTQSCTYSYTTTKHTRKNNTQI